MKSKKYSFSLIVTLISIVCSIVILGFEASHHCSGEGCTICLLSTISLYLTSFLFALSIVPFAFQHLMIYFSNHKSVSSSKENYDYEKESKIQSNLFNIDLITLGVKLQ